MITANDLPASFPAGVLRGPKQLEIVDVPMWPLETYGDDDMVMIEVEACGVCGSDFRYYLGENPWAQHTLGHFVPNPPNIVLGHEYAGTVLAVLDERNQHLLGQRVAPICSKVCGACTDCLSGNDHLCPNTIHIGHGQGWGDQAFFPGAYGRFCPAWGSSCYVVPDQVSMPEAAMMDILAVCVHVAHQGRIQPNFPALCIGAGPAGNGVAQASLAMGASDVVVLDQSQLAIDIAIKQGLPHALNTAIMSRQALLDRLKDFAPNGFTSVFDSVGTEDSLELGISQLAKRGTLVNLAVHDQTIAFNYARLGSERSVTTSCNFQLQDFEMALTWLEHGIFKVADWITNTELSDIPTWFENITSSEAKPTFKLVIEPHST